MAKQRTRLILSFALPVALFAAGPAPAADVPGIAAARLSSDGVGYLAPTATNLTEDGRALNRRVELVRDKVD